MAQIELRLSSKVQKETGKSEVMICLRYSKKDLSAKSEIFVNPDFFEYFIDRKKTKNPRQPLPDNKNLATMAKAAKNGWVLRRSGEIVKNTKAMPTQEVTEHNEKADKMEDLKKAILNAYNEAADKESLTSDWLKDIIERHNHPNKFAADGQKQKTFAELAEEYYTIPHGGRLTALSNDQQRAYKVLVRAVARYEGYIQFTKDKSFRFDYDTITRNDIAGLAEYLKNEKELSERYPSLFKRLLSQYPLAIGEGRSVLQGRGENTIKNMLDRLKSLFRYFVEKGYTTNRPFDGFKIGAERYGTPVYITIDERNIIADADLATIWETMPKDERQLARMPIKTLMEQRDIFVFHCLVGCRVSDLIKFTEKNIHEGILTYTPHKTKDAGEEQVQPRVPLHPKALALIEKYRGVDRKGRLFPFISPQKYNIALKVIFRMAGITRNVEVRNALTGENEFVPINTIASSHLARRTFIGNAYFKVQDPALIGKMSGHVEGSEAFKRYRKIEDATLKDVINLIG